MEVSLGKVKVPYNPENATPFKAEAIAVGCDNFKHNNGHAVRSYTLLIRVTSDSLTMCNGYESGKFCKISSELHLSLTNEDRFTIVIKYSSQLIVVSYHVHWM